MWHNPGRKAPLVPLRELLRSSNRPAAGAAFAASHGGRLFKLEDVALASWLEWAAERGNFSIHRVADRR